MEDEIRDAVLRVEAQNDRSNWHAVPKPPLGEIKKLDDISPYLDKDQLLKLIALAEVVELEHYAGSLFMWWSEGVNPLWLRQEARRLLGIEAEH